MDFLDPRKRRSHKIRLVIGYFLMATVIGLVSYLLFNIAYGFGYNTKTGQIIQNGLLFVGSKPGGADIYLNGKSQNATTSARLVLPAGNYDINLKKAGYRSWERKFSLDEHSVARYVYPLLLPVKPQISTIQVYPNLPPIISESPDRHW